MTLGMLTLREGNGVRVEGNRLAKNVTVIDAKGVTEARKLLAAVEQENARKAIHGGEHLTPAAALPAAG